MSEQWFLDLDGVRSGPYQTSEVLALVAEGEILPHHQIATELKSQQWMTILEWRLSQNKKSEPPPPKEPAPISPPVAEIILERAPDIRPEVPPVTVSPPEVRTAKLPKESPAPVPPSLSEPPPVSAPRTPKKDPMKEMFDILQNTKHKREVKSQQASAAAQAQSATATPYTQAPADVQTGGSHWGKTIAIAIGITILGFALGQYFQKQKKAAEMANHAQKTAPTPTSTPPATPAAAANVRMETVDRSTDKMTIRGRVPVMNKPVAPPPPPPPAATPDRSIEAQDLKDLKKELLELKALKEKIQLDNPDHYDSRPNRRYEDPMDPEGAEYPEEDGSNPVKPVPEDVHY